MPAVTIGLAVYNGEATLRAALDSLLAQTFRDFVLVVSDNGSTDATAAICADYAARDARIVYRPHSRTVSVWANYRGLLMDAKTPYFMGAAADDLWAPGFLAALHGMLTARPDAVMAQGRVLFTVAGVPVRMSTGTSPLAGDVGDNLLKYLHNPSDNSRFYGLYRTNALQQCFGETFSFALDWTICALSLSHGAHLEVHDLLMVRDETPAPRYARSATAQTKGPLGHLAPLWPLARTVWQRMPEARGFRLAAALFRLNLRIALRFMSYALLHRLPSESDGGGGRWSYRLALPLRRLLEPGIRERAAEQKSGEGVRQPRTFGWQFPTGAPADDGKAIVILCQDQALPTLDRIDRLVRDGNGDGARASVVVVDRGSVDATGLILAKVPGLRWLRMPESLTDAAAIDQAGVLTGAKKIDVLKV